MICYVMAGTNDLVLARRFHDAVRNPLALTRVESDLDYLGYSAEAASHGTEFYVTQPFDQQPVTHGNGSMTAFSAKSQAVANQFHQIALQNGGTDESPSDQSHSIALSIMLISAISMVLSSMSSMIAAQLYSALP